MAIFEVIDSLDSIPEEEKKNWQNVNGKFQREVGDLPDVAGLKSALQKERDLGKDFKKKLEAYKDVDVEKYKELLTAYEKGLPDKERYEIAIKKLNDDLTKAKATNDSTVAALNSKLKRLVLDKEARKEALAAGVDPEAVEDLLVLTEKNRQLSDDDKITILDDDGILTGKSLKEFFETLKDKKPRYFVGLPNGSGTPPDSGQHSKSKTMTRAQYDATDHDIRKKFLQDGGTLVD